MFFGLLAVLISISCTTQADFQDKKRDRTEPVSSETEAEPVRDMGTEPIHDQEPDIQVIEEPSPQEPDMPVVEGPAPEFPVGLWIEVWDYQAGMEDYTPGSYGFAGKFQKDYFYYFRADGTGIFFARNMVVDDEYKLISIISEYDQDTGEYTVGKEVNIRMEFTWAFEDEKIRIKAGYQNLFNQNEKELFDYEESDTFNRNFQSAIDGYKLAEGYLIHEMAMIKRFDPEKENEFLLEYDIEP